MYAVIRTYLGVGAKQLFDSLEEHKVDVEATLRAVPGLISYTLLMEARPGQFVRIKSAPMQV